MGVHNLDDRPGADPEAGFLARMRLAELFTLATALGEGTHGVMTAPQLRAAGAQPEAVAAALRRHWQAPVRGIYLPHRRLLTDVELAHVALAHGGPDAVVTGLLVARADGLRWLPDDVAGAMVLVPPEIRRLSFEDLLLVRRCSALPGMPTRSWEGLPVAPPARVVVDTCRQLLVARRARVHPLASREPGGWFETWCLRDVRGVVLGAIADGYCTAREVTALLDGGPRRDSALLRRALRDARRGAASPPEAELVDGLLECGVTFACNVELWDGDVLVAVLDVHLIGTGVGGELDSKEAHGRADLLDATLQRDRRVSRHGIELLHVTPTRYRSDPARFHEQLFATARDRLRRGLGDPPGLRLAPRGPVLRGPRVSRPPYRLPAVRPRRAA